MQDQFTDRFWASLDRSGECWLWTKCLSRKGYGLAWNGQRVRPAHRYAWEATFGEIPGGLDVLHRCRVKHCCRPDHLYLGKAQRFDLARERFWESLDRSGECWTWAGTTNPDGYGIIWNGKRGMLAHRHAWILTHGPIAGEDCVLHRCDNPPCCRPDHLFLGTHAENAADMKAKGRARAVRSLTDDQVRELRRLRATGQHTYYVLGEMFGISYQAAHAVATRVTYKNVDQER